MNKEYNIGKGRTLVFYQKEGDEKYSFLIKDDKELTATLLANCKTKRVKGKDFKYAVAGIIDKLDNQLIKEQITMGTTTNPIVELSLKIQKMYGENIITEMVSQEGPDHCPTITMLISLPNGDSYTGVGNNKKEASKDAARKALVELFSNK